MKSEAYWRRRAEGILLEAERNTTDYLNQLNVLYRNTAEEIDRKIKKTFDTYQKDFTAEQAKQWLNEVVPKAEYDQLKNSISSMTDERMKKQTLMRLNAPAYRYRITRLQNLKQQIMAELSIAADREKQVTTQCYVDAVKYSYYHTMYELQQGVGVGFSFAQLPHSTIDRLLSARWYGRNYSASIWKNRGQVATAAANVIKVGVLAGQSIPDMSKALMEQTYTNSMRNATRLVRTEVNYFSNQGAIESYKEAGIEKYEFMATLDLRTSPMCREHDGKTYLIREAAVGENYPPLHPYCRSTVAAVVGVPGLERMDKRAARNLATGKITDIHKMTYNEWKKQYIEKSLKTGILEDINLEPLPITVESIKRVKIVPSEILFPELQGKLRNEHKKLLMSIVSKPAGTEAGATFDLNMQCLSRVIGESAAASVKIPKESVPYIAIHTHPTGGTFTHTDLRLFAKDDNMVILTAVGNNGAVYAVEKRMDFSYNKYLEYRESVISRHLDYLKTPQKYAAYMQDFLSGVDKCGVSYYTAGT